MIAGRIGTAGGPAISNQEQQADFSLVLGGPLFQLLRRTRLSGDALELLTRRIVVLAAVAWLPLLLLSLASGRTVGDDVAIPFIGDFEVHVRFLVALPLLVAAELVVHRRLLPVVRQFLERKIVREEDLGAFDRAVDRTRRLRNSVWIELGLVAFVYTAGSWIWRNGIAQSAASWYADPDAGGLQLTPAGLWLAYVSVPIFQFLLIRWYFRFLLWFVFLLRVARLRLQLVPTHADRTAGLGFLGVSVTAFAPVLMAQGAMLAALIASQIFHAGRSLPEFKVEVVAFVGFFIVVSLLPLTVFTPALALAKRRGLLAIGRLASRYSGGFEGKWLEDDSADAELLGSADIQSLADLGNSYGVVQEMRFAPFGWRDVTRLAAVTATPFLPLLLTVFSLEDFANFIIKAVF
jgi:hypothetical protein